MKQLLPIHQNKVKSRLSGFSCHQALLPQQPRLNNMMKEADDIVISSVENNPLPVTIMSVVFHY